MTEQLATLSRRLDSVQQLEAVTTAMRAIAATRARQSRAAVPAIRAFAAVVSAAIAQALPLVAAGDAHPAGGRSVSMRILLGAEQGFTGGFNTRVLDAACGEGPILMAGSRLVLEAAGRGLAPVWSTAMSPRADGVPLVAGRIADALFSRIGPGRSPVVELIFPVWSDGMLSVQRRSLLPFDASRFARPWQQPPPLITLPPADLLSRLGEEYVFAMICEGAMTAFAAENEARAAAMASARTNIARTRAELEREAQFVRQEEITAEVSELCRSGRAELGGLDSVSPGCGDQSGPV